MKKIILIFFFIPLVSFADWGKTGHRVIGEIAAMNLTPEATAAVKDLLEGRHALAHGQMKFDLIQTTINTPLGIMSTFL